MDKIYMIRRDDGLFSVGGHSPRFAKTGKIWKSLATLHAHLRTTNTDQYRSSQVVVYNLTEVETISPAVVADEAILRSLKSKARATERRSTETEDRERKEWERLRAKFGS